ATVLWGFILGSNPTAIWQSVASGLIGKSAFDGGTATAALGLALHFFIAFVMALVYVMASRRLPVLISRPIVMGMLYGLALYVVMNFVVVPLSTIGMHPLNPWGAVRALLPHILFVGPAISLIAALRARTAR